MQEINVGKQVDKNDNIVFRAIGYEFLIDGNGNKSNMRYMVFVAYRQEVDGTLTTLVDDIDGVMIPVRVASIPVQINVNKKPKLSILH